MKTLVYQSFRTSNVPSWIAACMHSVRDWSRSRGYEYAFVGDELFACVPAWYRRKTEGQVHLLADLARLLLAREFLAKGYERTIWIDADVVVFSADEFRIPAEQEFAFCHEIYIDTNARKDIIAIRRVNNAVTVFTQNNRFLDFYLYACEEIVKRRRRLRHFSVGTGFLTEINRQVGLPVITSVGLFSPIVMSAIHNGIDDIIALYMRCFANRICAANLCSTFFGRKPYGITMNERLYHSVISRLLESGGDVVNDYLPSGPHEHHLSSGGS